MAGDERAAAEHALALVTVLGGAGVGKTRLVLEAAGRLEGDPAVLVGRCLPYGNGSTFWPLAEVVRQAAGIGLEDPPEEARAKLAALLEEAVPEGALVAERIGQLIGLEADPAPIEEAAWSTGRLLEALAAERPLVVVFDDLHWAEPTFLDLVERLGEGGRGAPVLLVAVARPELLEQRPAWAGGRPNAVSMLLEPLGPEESAALLDGLAGGGTLPATARERITRAAGGNPLFIEELLATLVEEGRLRRQGDAWTGWTAATGTCWSGPRSSGRRSSRTRWPRCPRRTPGPGSPSVWAGWSARVPAHRPGPPARRVPGGLNETRMQFTTQVTGVLLEARGEAGEERLVDPELLAALTEALILAAGDPRPWRDG